MNLEDIIKEEYKDYKIDIVYYGNPYDYSLIKQQDNKIAVFKYLKIKEIFIPEDLKTIEGKDIKEIIIKVQ